MSLKPCKCCGHDQSKLRREYNYLERVCLGCGLTIAIGWIDRLCQKEVMVKERELDEKWNRRPSPWVPVSERLPEKDENSDDEASIMVDVFWNGQRLTDCLYYYDGCEWFSTDIGRKIYGVTHFMYQPPAPEGA